MTHVPPEVAQAITRQKARYARYSDLKQWDKFAQEIALPDARYSFLDTDGNPLVLGKQALVFDSAKSCATFYSNSFAQMDTHHAVGPGDFEQVAPDQVKAVFSVEGQVISKQLGSWVEIRGGGYYFETWQLVDGQWYLKEMTMQRTFQKESFLVTAGTFVANLLGLSLF
ncbi:hypothetical protein NM208_g5319 [Fusarium decemcellulare]|uniref:Uncharacterized protein n=1 Tax=Fusarium decemcellulare TaxID=57161 RepID=A0ACC1SHQ9_9HYPO|nr:hypothetical protein NM208_g5319 [Fusarium decemcellulare]